MSLPHARENRIPFYILTGRTRSSLPLMVSASLRSICENRIRLGTGREGNLRLTPDLFERLKLTQPV